MPTTRPGLSVVTRVMDPVLPGAYAIVTVGGGNEHTVLYAIPIANGDAASPRDGGQAQPAGEAVGLPVVHRQEECFTVDVPPGPPAIWAIQTRREFDPATAWLANRPRIDWCFPARGTPGGEVTLIGRNLVRYDRYVTQDPARPVSFGGQFASPEPTRACLRLRGTADFVPVPVLRSSAYEAVCRLPASVRPGPAELYVHSGLGGAAGWSEPLLVEIAAPDVWPDRRFPVDDYLARGGSVDAAFAAALADIARNGGGVLELWPRTYPLRRTLVLPPRTVMRGAGADRTLLSLPFDPALGRPEPPYVAVTGDSDFALEDLCIRGVHAPVLVCAPRFEPVSQDEAASGCDAIGLSDRRARNVAIRRCRLEQHPFRQSMRRKDFDPRGWMKGFGEKGWRAMGDHSACLFFKGDGLEVEGCTILGGGHAVDLNRSACARVSGNTLQAGFFGMALHGFTRLTWPSGGGGARIAGNEMRRVIVADNDISARSEFARNLISFNFGGDELYIARNHIHDYAPNCDSEALMTHLWQARWCKPAIRMTGPVTAEIVDPAGEVRDECLDGAWLDIVDGRGLGQVRQIVRREGNRIEIDRPWRADPDESSRVVFTAPSLFRHLTMVDNRIVSQAVNIIVYGSSYDSVIDGNYVADGPGITLWSVRLAADQKVWGGAVFTLVCNNVLDRGWSTPTRDADALDGAVGVFVRCSRVHDCSDAGYDVLGLIVRNNHSTNNAGIGFRTTFSESGPGGARRPWRIRYAGVVIDRNLCTDSAVGIAVEKGAQVVLRDNRSRNVTFPVTEVGVPGEIAD